MLTSTFRRPTTEGLASMRDVKISIVIPAFREGDHLSESLSAIIGILHGQSFEYELIVVDDGSDDDTWDTLQHAAESIAELHAISFTRNFGKEAAIVAGLSCATGNAAIVMDADLQHPPALIPEMVRLWRDHGYEIVNAIKQDRGTESTWNRFAALTFYNLFARVSGLQLMNGSDFKLLDRKVVNVYCELPERDLLFRGIVTWLGYRQCLIPFSVSDRIAGEPKWNLMTRAVLAVNAFTSFTAIPLQLVTIAGLLTLLTALGLSVQTLYVWASGQAVEGFTTVILLILAIGAILMISLGIIGQYLAKIYDELKRRPRYLIGRQIRLDLKASQTVPSAEPVVKPERL